MHCVCNVKLLCEWPGFEPGCFPKMVVVRNIIGPRHHEVVLWHVLNLEKTWKINLPRHLWESLEIIERKQWTQVHGRLIHQI